jgi:hypothetical protein
MRFFTSEDPVHRRAAELLPWYVNATLSGDERAGVEHHLSECVICRDELAALRTLRAAIAQEDPAIEHSLARMRARAEALEAGLSVRWWRAVMRNWRDARPWLRAVVAGQFVLLLVLGAVFGLSELKPHYYATLSSAAPPSTARGSLVVVFDGSRTEQDIRAALLILDARIVDGPTPEGAYALEVPAGREQAALTFFRQQRMVNFAEPAAAHLSRSK